jgi:hypothetical protein
MEVGKRQEVVLHFMIRLRSAIRLSAVLLTRNCTAAGSLNVLVTVQCIFNPRFLSHGLKATDF